MRKILKIKAVKLLKISRKGAVNQHQARIGKIKDINTGSALERVMILGNSSPNTVCKKAIIENERKKTNKRAICRAYSGKMPQLVIALAKLTANVCSPVAPSARVARVIPS